MKLKLKFNDVNEVKKFVDITSQYGEQISLVHGRYVVDAKSILGIFSMDLTKPVDLVCDRANDQLKDELSDFVLA